LVLQSCTDPLQILPGSSSETCQTGCDDACDVSRIKVEGINVEEDGTVVKEEMDIGSEKEEGIDVKENELTDVKQLMSVYIKEEEISFDTVEPTIESEQDKVNLIFC
jgi:hypothetical protein